MKERNTFPAGFYASREAYKKRGTTINIHSKKDKKAPKMNRTSIIILTVSRSTVEL